MGGKYEWMTLKEISETAKKFAAGATALNLCPEVEAEGRTWKFLGIQAKNRKEWYLAHLANMHMGATTIALYDTLGNHAQKYVIGQTELVTIVCTEDIVKKICALKKEDLEADLENRKMNTLTTLVVIDALPEAAR